MRFISSLEQHPETRKERFSEDLWPRANDAKGRDEGWIFLEFAEAAGIRLDCAPIKRRPPTPDLECVIDGKRRLFELGEALETKLGGGLAHSVRQSRRKMEATSRGDAAAANSVQTAGFRRFPANRSLERILEQKLAKRYETAGLPADLLLYYDRQRPWGPFDYLLQWQDELARLMNGSVFQRVWVFDLESAALGYLEAAPDRSLRAIFDWRFHFDHRAAFLALVPGGGQKPDEVRQFFPVLTEANAGH